MNTNPTEALSTLQLVKAEPGTGITSNTAATDAVITEFINDLSQYWLQRTGAYTLSTTYVANENYNGTGRDTLPLRNHANSITQLTIGTVIVPQSTAVNKPGWFLSDDGLTLYVRGWYSFLRGRQNINVQYNAGYSVTPGDITRAFTRHVALELKRKDSINLKSQSLTGGGNVTFDNDVEVPMDIERVIRMHTRVGF